MYSLTGWMLPVVAVCSSSSCESPVCAEPLKQQLQLCAVGMGRIQEQDYANYRMESIEKFTLSQIPIDRELDPLPDKQQLRAPLESSLVKNLIPKQAGRRGDGEEDKVAVGQQGHLTEEKQVKLNFPRSQ